jgi:hypothetical protein
MILSTASDVTTGSIPATTLLDRNDERRVVDDPGLSVQHVAELVSQR